MLGFSHLVAWSKTRYRNAHFETITSPFFSHLRVVGDAMAKILIVSWPLFFIFGILLPNLEESIKIIYK